MKELMTPFLRAYVRDLLLDITENIPSIDSPEDMEDYKDAGGTETKKFDMIVTYVTYNDGHFVDPNVHGGAIRLSVEECKVVLEGECLHSRINKRLELLGFSRELCGQNPMLAFEILKLVEKEGCGELTKKDKMRMEEIRIQIMTNSVIKI